jgi:hypothetical protein
VIVFYVWPIIFAALGFAAGYIVRGSNRAADDRVYLAERKARWLADWVRIAAKHNATLANAQLDIELALGRALAECDAAPGAESQICTPLAEP